jgi:hypothetical protein
MHRKNGKSHSLRGVRLSILVALFFKLYISGTEKRREEKAKAEAEASDAAGRPPTEDAGSGMEVDRKEVSGPASHAHPPQKKYRMTERMKGILWRLVSLSNEACRVENEKKYVIETFFCFFSRLTCFQFIGRFDYAGQ